MSAPRPDTWMPIFWGDYMRDTGHLDHAGHGAYLMLIKHYWCANGPLPDDDAVLARIACCPSPTAWKKIRATMAAFFTVADGLWRHKRIDAELAAAIARVAKKSSAGKKGADARWQNAAGANGKPDGALVTTALATASGCQSSGDGKPMHISQSQSQSKNPIPAQQPYPGGNGRDNAAPDFRVVGERCCVLAGIDTAKDPVDFSHVLGWLKAGFDVETDIYPAIELTAARVGYRTPRGLNYFTKMVREAHDNRISAERSGSTVRGGRADDGAL